jgi:hypothetical protein
VRDEIPDRLMSPDGRSGWYAVPLDGRDEADEPWTPPREGSVIRLMGEYSVDVPLWGEDGLMFSEPEELVRELGVSEELATDLKTWAKAWESRSDHPDFDAVALRLVRRLRAELDHRYEIVYHP